MTASLHESPVASTATTEVPLFDRGLTFVGWAFNEEECIGEYLEQAVALLDRTAADYEILLVNDGSTDRTREIVLEKARFHPRIRLIDNPGNRGVAYACRNAIEHAEKEFFMWQTVDWSYDISRLRQMLELLREYDVIAGVRREPVQATNQMHRILLGLLRLFNIRHITRRSDTLWKAIVSLGNYILIRTLFNVPLSDYQNVCIYRTEVIRNIRSEARSSFSNPEFLFKAYWAGARIAEVPISFIPRKQGEAKGTRIKSICASISDIVGLWSRWVLFNRIDRSKPGRIQRLRSEQWQSEGVESEPTGAA